MPVYSMKKNGKLETGKWRIRIRHKGRRKDRMFLGTKAEAKVVEAEMRLEFEAGDPVEIPTTAPTFSSFCVSQYRRHAETHLKSSTWRNREYQLARLMVHFGQLRLTAFTVDRVEKFKTHRLREGIRPSAINDDLKVLRTVLQYAMDLGFPCTIPKWKKLPERGRARVQAWTEEEVTRLLSACEEHSPDILPLVVFLVNTGCRKGEAIALRAENVDLETGVIHIGPTDDWSPKNNKARQVPVNAALRPWLAPERLGKVWAFPCRSTGKRWALWPDRKFKRAVDKAGLEGGPHRLRHTYATHLVRATGDLFLVSRVLGHSHTRVTELYSHLLPGHLARAGEAVQFDPAVTAAEHEARKRWKVEEI